MAGAKKRASRRKKRRSQSSPTPTPSSVRSVRQSSAPTTREIARRLGVSPSTVRRRALAGTLRAVRDDRGRYHFPSKGAAPSARPRKKPPFRKKRARTSRPPPPPPRKKRAKQTPPPSPPPRRKKRASARAPSPGAPSIRLVSESSSPTLRDAAALFGTSVARLRALVESGKVRALRDGRGELFIPAARLQAKQLAGKRVRKKRAREGKLTPPPWMTTGESRRRKKKKRAGKRKLVPGKKKKRVRKTRPPRERFEEAIERDTGPSRFHEEPPPPPPEPTRAAPMPMEEAAQRIGDAMRDFVMARPRWERLETGRVFHDLKVSFRKTYGDQKWRDTYAWCVDEWGLEDYIFDYEALRDS